MQNLCIILLPRKKALKEDSGLKNQEDNGQSSQASQYSKTAGSDNDSLDAMSLVSSSEIKGLVADQHDFDEDGYDTETTDNTSPSHKKRKPSRKSGSTAQNRIADFYSTPESFDISEEVELEESSNLHTQPSPPSHPLPNTNSTNKGHGTTAT